MKVCKYASMQVCKNASMKVWKYESMKVCKHVNIIIIQVYKHASMQGLRFF